MRFTGMGCKKTIKRNPKFYKRKTYDRWIANVYEDLLMA